MKLPRVGCQAKLKGENRTKDEFFNGGFDVIVSFSP